MLTAAVIADDLTGALEMGALLAERQLRTVVTTELDGGADCDALVLDTESRNSSAAEAAERVRTAVRRVPQGVPVFKKLDSTLRGPIAAEIRALLDALGQPPLCLSPGYPALGRTVRSGCLYVNGVPVAQSDFARDPRCPVTQSRIDLPMADSETDEDLQRIVDSAAPHTVFAGSGGLGRAWVRRLPKGHCAPAQFPPVQRPLVVCGSRHPISLAQAQYAARTGVRTLMASDEVGNPEHILEHLANSATKIETDALILFGGDTAAAVLRQRGIVDLRPLRELLTGVVLSCAPDPLLVVTKAGGFGGPNVVEQILGQLT